MAQKIAPFLSRISLTMDAIDADIQIEMRKNTEITDHTIDLIKIFHDLNVPVNVKTLITKINKNEIEKIGKILSNLPIKYWSLLEFVPLNRGKTNQSNFLLKPAEFNEICAKIKNEFPLVDIKIRKFSSSERGYCFIAPNGKVYTYLRDKGDILVGDISCEELNSIIKKIEN